MPQPRVDVLVVGAGFAGCTMAERLASAGRSVLLIDRREHLGGNAFDEFDAHGVRIHRYGPHIFHTNSSEVVTYLSRFTAWHPYVHRVRANVRGQLLPVPINRTTINTLYGLSLDESGIAAWLEQHREARSPISTSEDVVLNTVGRELYELFFRGYTRKQWALDPSQLDAQVTARIPVRTNDDDRYFTDTHQAMPADGYTAMFERMTAHPNIHIELGRDFDAPRDRDIARNIVYTGPVDAYFAHQFGRLPYRSLRFEHHHLADCAQFQPVGTVNEPDESILHTRTTEIRHITGQAHTGTSIVREFPQSDGDPYYPVPTRASRELYLQYQNLAQQETHTTFVGRLAQYRYYNMDQVVAAALTQAKQVRCP